MNEIRAYDMSKYQRIIAVEGRRVNGSFKVSPNDKETWVQVLDVNVWDAGHNWGRILYSGDLTCSVKDGVADLHEHMIASNKRDDVLSVWDEMKAAIVAAADAFPVAALREAR